MASSLDILSIMTGTDSGANSAICLVVRNMDTDRMTVPINAISAPCKGRDTNTAPRVAPNILVRNVRPHPIQPPPSMAVTLPQPPGVGTLKAVFICRPCSM